MVDWSLFLEHSLIFFNLSTSKSRENQHPPKLWLWFCPVHFVLRFRRRIFRLIGDILRISVEELRLRRVSSGFL